MINLMGLQMYTEFNDFKEKLDIFEKIKGAVFELCGANVINNSSLALEIGGIGGLLAGIVSNAGPRVICTDIVDTQVNYNGEFPRLLKEKFERNGIAFDLSKVEFHKSDAQDLIYGNEKFDFVYSLNAFEHIPDPIKAINETARVLRKGGVFYASFDPVWTADSGSHFIEYVVEPWLHLLLSDAEFRTRMREGGAAQWQIDQYPAAMNGLPAGFYKKEFTHEIKNLFRKSAVASWSGCINHDHVDHPNRFNAAKLMRSDPDELLIRGFQFVAVK